MVHTTYRKNRLL